MDMVKSYNIPDAYNEVWWKLNTFNDVEETRNGKVKAYPEPFVMTIQTPDERVLFDRKRNCNHFFHLAEVVWMFAGEDDVRFLEYYNSRMRDFADEGTDIVHGAYGKRWTRHFRYEQITEVVDKLTQDSTTPG